MNVNNDILNINFIQWLKFFNKLHSHYYEKCLYILVSHKRIYVLWIFMDGKYKCVIIEHQMIN